MITVPLEKQSPKNYPIESVTLDVQGMKCAGCVNAVERQISQCPGVVSATVNLVTSIALVEYEKEKVLPEKLAQKLTMGGFPSSLRVGEETKDWSVINQRKREEEQKAQFYQLISAIILLLFSTIGHLHHLGFHYLHYFSNIWFHWGLATLALLIPGREILLNGWQSLWHRQPNMNSLIGIGTVSAYLASCVALVFPELGWECFFDEPVMLLGFIFLGRVLEGKARNKTSSALEELLSLRPQWARVVGKEGINQDQGLPIPSGLVKPSEWVKVLPGEQFPVDGKVVMGQTTVDESTLTGESIPVFKSEGSLICAGTINETGLVIVETVSSGAKTILSQIIATVEEAQTRKAPIQNLADTVSGYFAYGIMTIALGTFFFWYGWGTSIWSSVLVDLDTSSLILSLKLAIDVLVIACPCALGLATPTAILVGTGVGAQEGLLIKGGDVLEQAQNLDIIVFDKTGTLTQGYPQVTDILPWEETKFSPAQLLQIAASLEINSNHPLAQGLLQESKKLDLSLLKTSSLVNGMGKGVKGDVFQESAMLGTFYCGNELWLKEQNILLSPKIIEQSLKFQTDGKTVIYLAQENNVIALFALGDKLRPFARETVTKLKDKGLEVILLSGDQENVAKAIALQLEITQYYGGIQSPQKAQIIRNIKNKYPHKVIAMVGDGINDAPAMIESDFAIAMAQGVQIAVKTASIVLTRGNLMDILSAIDLSEKTLAKIKQNLFWALSYNLITIPIAAGILLPKYHFLLNPATAGGFMAISSIVVVTNSLQLKNWKISNKY